MGNEYDNDSCSGLERPFYRPIEAALRWCGLIDHEVMILEKVGNATVPSPEQFPEWPCLRVNAEKIFYAMLSKELPCGRDGRNVPQGEVVAQARMTVKHTDLKEWVKKHEPGQRPAFLFSHAERLTNPTITTQTYSALEAEHDNLARQLKKLQADFDQLLTERDSLNSELNTCRKLLDLAPPSSSGLGERATLDQSPYWSILVRKAQKAIDEYPGWKKAQRHVSKTGNLMDWLIELLDINNREAELIKKVLSDIYNELK